MVLKKVLVVKNPCYRNGRKIIIKGLMLHSVGCAQPNPAVFINNWNDVSATTCVHGVIGADGTAYQILPWNYRAWHCGSGAKGSGNQTHIGVEMTEPSTIKYIGGANWKDLDTAKTKAHVLATYKTAVELFAYLCDKFHLNPLADGVIISHHEGNERGIASSHADVEHIWSKFGLTMDKFRKDVKAKMASSSSSNDGVSTVHKVPVTPTPTSTKEYKVKVTDDALNIRKRPTADSEDVGTITDHGVYTITKTDSGWGCLKSGAGWVCLKYTEKVK